MVAVRTAFSVGRQQQSSATADYRWLGSARGRPATTNAVLPIYVEVQEGNVVIDWQRARDSVAEIDAVVAPLQYVGPYRQRRSRTHRAREDRRAKYKERSGALCPQTHPPGRCGQPRKLKRHCGRGTRAAAIRDLGGGTPD